MAGLALGTGATGLGADDGVYRGAAIVRHGAAKGTGAAVGHIDRDDHVGGVHGRFRPDAVVVSVGPGAVARTVYGEFDPAAQRLVLFICAGRVHGGDHCFAGHK